MSLSMVLMKRIVHSKSAFLNPDKNVVLNALLRGLVYNQFCAGTNPAEVRDSVARTKAIGFKGVILGYAKEIVLEDPKGQVLSEQNVDALEDPSIAAWLDGNMKTLDLIGEGDYMNIKFTGAGGNVSQALLAGEQMPPQMEKALGLICEQAKAQKSRLWIDAEQQVFQTAIDDWTISLMRQYNRDGHALVANTIQAYLKDARENVIKHLQLAQSEGWSLGIKLVRGAYISSDTRESIWPTKAETDENYNSIAQGLVRKDFAPFEKSSFPDVHLFLAGHNRDSIRLVSNCVHDLVKGGADVNPVGYGQLQGMADGIGCELVQNYEDTVRMDKVSTQEASVRLQAAPRAYKCLAWGSVQECLHYLMRRAVENASATDRLKDGLVDIRKELGRRLWPMS